MEFLELLQTAYEIPGRVPGRVRVVAFPANPVAQGPSYDLTCEDFVNFPFVVAINLYW
jgi:hypothetical protein